MTSYVRAAVLAACVVSSSIVPAFAAPSSEELDQRVAKLEAAVVELRRENAELRSSLAENKSTKASARESRATPPPEQPVNVNVATRQELEAVPRIGRTLAQRIIAGRPYGTVDEVKNVEGISAKTFEAAKPYLTVGQ